MIVMTGSEWNVFLIILIVQRWLAFGGSIGHYCNGMVGQKEFIIVVKIVSLD